MRKDIFYEPIRPDFLCPGYFFERRMRSRLLRGKAMKQKLNVNETALIGLLGGLGAVLMLFNFPLPFMPPFMSFDLAGLPEIIGGFTLGPIAAVFIILVKILVKFVLMSSSSALTGELQNVILSCAYVLPSVLIYNRHKTKKTAAWGMVAGTVICALTAVFTNLVIIIPFYVNLMGMSWEGVVQMCTKVNPLMKDPATMAIFGIIPFNLIKNGAVSLLAFLLYKKVSRPLKSFAKK